MLQELQSACDVVFGVDFACISCLKASDTRVRYLSMPDMGTTQCNHAHGAVDE